MSITRHISPSKLLLFFFLTVALSLVGGAWSNTEAATPAQFKKECNSYNSAIKKAEKQKVNVKAAKKTYTQLCKTSTVTTPSESDKNLKKIKKEIETINKKTQSAKEYKEKCKTAAQKKKPECKTLATAAGIGPSGSPDPGPGPDGDPGEAIKKCGGVSTAFAYGCADADRESGGNDNPIFQVLFFIVNMSAMGVGIVAIGAVIFGSVLYTSAGDNGEQTKKGRIFVVNSVRGVIFFAFMYAILNFLVPGGLFS